MSSDNLAFYSAMLRIRRFEETVLAEFKRGVFSGTTHTSLGQEANAVGVIRALNPADIIVSNHRCHGHFLAYGGDPRALFAELMGKATGVCGGYGGSQHLHWRNFYSNGVLGGTLPLATGMALAEKQQDTGSITVVFMGDGALGEGSVYEALNMASLWGAPILFVVEDNHIAQTTPTRLALAGSMPARFTAFGISVTELDTSDVLYIATTTADLAAAVRREQRPQALILHTQRFGPHSKGDDTRAEAQLEQLRLTRDPLSLHAARLDDATRTASEIAVETEIRQAFEQALSDPEAQP